MVFPDYQPIKNKKARAFFEQLWGSKIDPYPGLTVVEIMDAIHHGEIKGMYIMGENPAMSDPNLNHARAALAMLDHLVVQDIFMTETAGFADVILPASAFPEKTGTFTNTDRRVQLGRQAIDPPGDARQDLWIIQELARRIGLDWNYAGPKEVFAEIRQAVPSMAGMTWERLEKVDSLTYPLVNEGDPGELVIFTDGFPTEDGRGRFVPVDFLEANEMPDHNFPYIFMTGRQLEHWHTGSMTRRATVLNAIEPEPVINLHPDDLHALGVEAGETIRLESRRGQLEGKARADSGMQKGMAFMAFCYHEAAANLLTTEALDPYGKIPEFKFCAVRIIPIHPARQLSWASVG
jgi:formate dehydrogenase major subunit